MTYSYSEDQLIEQPCIILLKELGWQTVNVMQGEVFGPLGQLGRDGESDVVLKHRFLDAVKQLNPDLPGQAYEEAYEEITRRSASKTLTEINQEKYHQLRDGIPVTFKNQKGEIVRNKRIKVFDLDHPEKNDFLAVQQLWIVGTSRMRRRPDVIGFVNGIPLVFIELKAHHRNLQVAHSHNLSDYLDVIPHLFHCNAFAILSNGLESKIGSATAPYGYFHEWKRIEEDEEGRISLETVIQGVCEKGRLLDLFENFILFDSSVEKTVKLIARNHQYIGVNKAIRHFIDQTERFNLGEIDQQERQKLGVFWHTQGSGKSYSMVFLTQKINRKVPGSFTFVIVTDRDELDKQIYETFSGVGAVQDKGLRARSGDHLKELLRTTGSHIFTLIHKFNFEEEITQRDNMIVISDEAHRTQSGSLALNMRRALPQASFMGFTGTPLFKDDEMTRRIFGDYVSIYDFKRSIEDHATVPLYYENRGEQLHLKNPDITQQMRDVIEEADLDPDQEDKVKRLFAREYPIITAEKRLRAIAKDVVWHFNNRGYKGKAMFVAIDKVTAVKMYNFITEAWEAYIHEQEKKNLYIQGDQESMEAARNLKWTKETEISVVVSSEQNEIKKFRDWGLDIEGHRLKMNTRDLEKEFKNEDHPFRFVIVCAMWITGFDVKSLSTMYLDKPLKTHTLMQTIARANRVHTGKNNGLIVDYIETYKSLLEALAIYAVGSKKKGGEPGEDDRPVLPPEKQLEHLVESIDAIIQFLQEEVGFDLDDIIHSESIETLVAIQAGVNAINATDDSRNRFMAMTREMFKRYKGFSPNPAIYAHKPAHDAINALYSKIQDNTNEADISAVMARVQGIVDASIENLEWGDIKPEYRTRIDISSLDFVLIEKEFLKVNNQNTTVQALKTIVERKLQQMMRDNPLRLDYYEQYQKIIEEYNRGKDEVEITEIFSKLKRLIEELSEEDSRATREELSEAELAIYDLLRQGKTLNEAKKHAVKDLAKNLLEHLQNDELQVDQWDQKTQTKARVKSAIQNLLFENLPYPEYEEADIQIKTDLVFEYLRGGYGMVA